MLRRTTTVTAAAHGVVALSSYYSPESRPTLMLNKHKYDAAVRCPKRLYYLEEAAALRHEAWFALKHGAHSVDPAALAAQWTGATDDDASPLDRGDFDVSDGGLTLVAPPGSGCPISKLQVPDVYAAMLAQPPPSVLCRFLDKNRMSQWCRLWHQATVGAKLMVRATRTPGSEDVVEARTIDIIAKHDTSKPLVLLDAVVGFKRPSDGVLCRTRIDVLQYVPNARLSGSDARLAGLGGPGVWQAFEFKSFLDPKPHHTAQLETAAEFHRYVLREALGVDLQSTSAVHLNRMHRRAAHDLRAPNAVELAATLCKSTPVHITSDATSVAAQVDAACALLQTFFQTGPPEPWSRHFGAGGKRKDGPTAPTPDPKQAIADASNQTSLCSSACSHCHFSSRCIPTHKVLPNNVFTVGGMQVAAKADFWNAGQRKAADLDPAYLTDTQARYVTSLLQGPQVNVGDAEAFFSALRYPIIFLDFESVTFPDPPFDTLTTYDQVPFQFSAEVFYDDWTSSTPDHYDFLNFGEGLSPREDPRARITEALMKMFVEVEAKAVSLGIPVPSPKAKHHIGTVIAHNATFEKGVLRKLELFCKNTQRAKYDARFTSENMPWMDSVKLVKSVVVPEAGGSHSLKNVLPAFAPQSQAGSYGSLSGIKDGGDANGIYSLYAAGWFSMQDKERVARDRDNFLAYCRLDTAGLVDAMKGIHGVVSRFAGRQVPKDATEAARLSPPPPAAAASAQAVATAAAPVAAPVKAAGSPRSKGPAKRPASTGSTKKAPRPVKAPAAAKPTKRPVGTATRHLTGGGARSRGSVAKGKK